MTFRKSLPAFSLEKQGVLKEILQDTAVGRTYTETDHNPWFLLLISFALYPDPYSQANYRIPPL